MSNFCSALGRILPLFWLSASAAFADYAPITNEFVVHPSAGGNQIWPSIAVDETRNRIWLTYSQSNETFARGFDLNFNPVTNPMQCNSTTNLQQDEPAISLDKVNGRVLVGWSDRSSQHTDYMDVRGRIIDTITGQFASPEIPLRDPNGTHPTESKWRPLLDAFPSGGWVVAFTSNWSEAAYIDHIGPNGEIFTGDILLTHLSGHQNYPDVNTFPDGTVYTVTLDGYNKYRYRIFNSQFQPLAGSYPVLSPSPFGQREMRLKNWNNKVYAAWTEMNGTDGDIRFQIFNSALQPLMQVFTVNETLPGLQKDVDLEVAFDGTVVIAWEDDSGGERNYRYRVFDSDGVPLSSERTINQHSANDLANSVVAPANVVSIPSQKKMVICWQGKSLVSNGGEDAFCRVLQDTSAGSNQSPMVSAGPDQSIALPNHAALSGNATDDGLPNPPGALMIQWTQIGGPGNVIFSDNLNLTSNAMFSQAGTYTLRLSGNDGVLSSFDDIQIMVGNGIVSAGSITETKFTACMNMRNPHHREAPQICYQLARPGHAKLTIYSKEGREIRVLFNEDRSAGANMVVWDRKDSFGEIVGSGVYTLILETLDTKLRSKIAVIK